jgi:hypothetical protein
VIKKNIKHPKPVLKEINPTNFSDNIFVDPESGNED